MSSYADCAAEEAATPRLNDYCCYNLTATAPVNPSVCSEKSRLSAVLVWICWAGTDEKMKYFVGSKGCTDLEYSLTLLFLSMMTLSSFTKQTIYMFLR